jgi:hypothetical protein
MSGGIGKPDTRAGLDLVASLEYGAHAITIQRVPPNAYRGRHRPEVVSVDRTTCDWLAKGFCAASVDGYCVGGYAAPDGARRCHG